MEKQFEKQTVEGYNGIKGWGSIEKDIVQRDFGVKGGSDEKPFIIAPEIIASLPGGEGISGDAIGIEKDNRFIEKDLGCLDDSADFFGVGLRDIGDPGSSSIGGGSSNIGTGAV